MISVPMRLLFAATLRQGYFPDAISSSNLRVIPILAGLTCARH